MNEPLIECMNTNMVDIVTPVRADVLRNLLVESGYNSDKIEFLYQGFSKGFSLNYQGNLRNVKHLSPNLKLRVGSPTELWNKVMKEVQLGHFAGPFETPHLNILSNHQLVWFQKTKD